MIISRLRRWAGVDERESLPTPRPEPPVLEMVPVFVPASVSVTVCPEAEVIPPDPPGQRRAAGGLALAHHPDMEMLSAEEHAARLLQWLQFDGNRDGPEISWPLVLTHADVSEAYDSMLVELYLAPRPWNAIAKNLRQITGTGKTYKTVPNPMTGKCDGSTKVLVWKIPAPTAEDVRRFVTGGALKYRGRPTGQRANVGGDQGVLPLRIAA